MELRALVSSIIIIIFSLHVECNWATVISRNERDAPPDITVLKGTITNLITQLKVYQDYIRVAFQPLGNVHSGFGSSVENLTHAIPPEPPSISVTIEPVIPVTPEQPRAPEPPKTAPVPMNGYANPYATQQTIVPSSPSHGNGNRVHDTPEIDLRTVFAEDCGNSMEPFSSSMAVGKTESGGFSFECGGTLVDKQIVVASASCIEQDVTVARANSGALHAIRLTVTHPEYKRGSLRNDIAIIFLREPVVITQSLPCIPEPSDSSLPGDTLKMVTWGFQRSQGDGSSNGRLNLSSSDTDVDIISNRQCETAIQSFYASEGQDFKGLHPGGIDDTLICSLPKTWSQCEDISGHQLLRVPSQGKLNLLGTVVNKNIGYYDACSEEASPIIFTNVSAHMDWILRVIVAYRRI